MWDLIVATVRVCLRYRVTGLSAEAGFFAILSLPPLILGLAASAGWIGSRLGRETRNQLIEGIQRLLEPFLTKQIVDQTVLPTFNAAITGPRYDLISIGFVLSLWSGSRALNVYIDTISIMYGLGGQRGIVRTRALSFSLYVVALVLSAVTLPLLVIGPGAMAAILPTRLEPILSLYWPVIMAGGIGLLTSLYHIATPVKTPWRRDLPGALLAVTIWILASWVMRRFVAAALTLDESSSIYGPLSTPIVVMMWLYLLAIAVLIGAALNAAISQLWPIDAKGARVPTTPNPDQVTTQVMKLPRGTNTLDVVDNPDIRESSDARVSSPSPRPDPKPVHHAPDVRGD